MDSTTRRHVLGTFSLLLAMSLAPGAGALGNRVQIDAGTIEGMAAAEPGVRAFEGIPFAAPPLGPLRWREPQPVTPWSGVLKTTHFGPRPMQGSVFSDMVFRDHGPSEDCLYLNVWTPAKAPDEPRPDSADSSGWEKNPKIPSR